MTGIARSQRIIGFVSVVAGDNRTFTAPSEHVVLAKSIALYNGDVAAASVSSWLTGTGMTGNAYILSRSLASGELFTWEGFLTLNPADSITVYCFGINTSVWVSGAVLAGGNQFPSSTTRWEDLFGAPPTPPMA